MRKKMFDVYQHYNNKVTFDQFLFKNHIFYLLPDSYSPKIKGMIFLNKEKKQLQEKYIEFLSNFANSKKIKIIFLKGLVLASRLYANPDLRLSGDIDIYIEEEKNYKIIEELLIKNAFVKKKDETGFHTGFSKIENNNEIIIEVHRKLYVSSAEVFSLIKSVPVQEIKTGTVSYKCNNINVLDYSYEFLYLFMHSLRHFVDGTIHPIFFILSKYPVVRIIELVLYVNKFMELIDWEFIKDYFNKLKIGTLINNFLNLIRIFVPAFDLKIECHDSKNIFKGEVFFELYREISKFDPFDYIFYNSNQLWTKTVLLNNLKKQNEITLKKRYKLKIQKSNGNNIDLSKYSVEVDISNNNMIFSFFYPKKELFMEKKDFLWRSDSIELILFELEQHQKTFYHRFFSVRDNNVIVTFEDDYRRYSKGNYYNEIMVTEGVVGIVKPNEKENCILIEINSDVFNFDIYNVFFDFVINLNTSDGLIKLSLNEVDPNKYLLPFNYSRLYSQHCL